MLERGGGLTPDGILETGGGPTPDGTLETGGGPTPDGTTENGGEPTLDGKLENLGGSLEPKDTFGIGTGDGGLPIPDGIEKIDGAGVRLGGVGLGGIEVNPGHSEEAEPLDDADSGVPAGGKVKICGDGTPKDIDVLEGEALRAPSIVERSNESC